MKEELPTLFLVDDQKIVNFVNKKVIETSGILCSVFDFQNPKKALEALKNKLPDFVFLDIQMPEINGWQFLEELEKKQLTSKVIILTSSTSSLDKEKAKKYKNVIEYVEKPLSVKRLKSLYKKYCN